MAYTARQLVTEAYYLSGIVSRGFQTVSGDQLTDGVTVLNNVLADKSFDKRFIPYFKQYTFNGIVGQEKYFIPNLVEVESFTFNIGDVRYPSYGVGRKSYFATARLDTIPSLPFKWHMERTLGGADLYLYFEPAGAYVCKVWGKFGFDDVTADTDLFLTFDRFYTNYLEYEVAQFICNRQGVSLPPQTANTLEQFRIKMRDQSPIDLTIVKRSRMSGTPSLNFADINIGKGWRPPQ